MSLLSRHLSLAILLLSVTTAVAAEPVPAPPAAKTPEQAIAARRKFVQNGAQSTIYYRLDGLNPIEAVAYRRLEFLENEVERNRDEQHLIRLRVQNDTREETMATALASYSSFGVYRGRRFASSSSYGSSDFGSPVTAMANFEELKRAYLDVLDVERVRLGMPRLFPGAPVAPGAAAPGAAEPAAAVPAAAVPLPPATAPSTATSGVVTLAPQQAVANALGQFDMVVKAMNQGRPSTATRLSATTVPLSAPPFAMADVPMTVPPTVPRVALSNSPASKVDDRTVVKPTLAVAGSSGDGLLANTIFPVGIVPAAGTAAFVALCLFRLRRSHRNQAASTPPGLMALPHSESSYSSSLTGARSSTMHTYKRW